MFPNQRSVCPQRSVYPIYSNQPIYGQRSLYPVYGQQPIYSQPINGQTTYGQPTYSQLSVYPVFNGSMNIQPSLPILPMVEKQPDFTNKITPIDPITPEEYVEKNLGFIAYKSAGNYIITLGIPHSAKTNMARSDIVDKNYAKFRTNCVDVLKIQLKTSSIDQNEPNEKLTCLESVESDYDKNFIYKINTHIICNYDDNIEEVCTSGIHFYTTFEAAFFHTISTIFPSYGPFILKRWNDNGAIRIEEHYLNGEKHGTSKCLNTNTKLVSENNYYHGKLHGECLVWYTMGSLRSKTCYENDEMHGLHQVWFDNGNKLLEANYKNGLLHGTYKRWYDNGNIFSETNYENEGKQGLEQEWHKNGNKKSEINYVDGELNGIKKAWHENGNKFFESNYVNGYLHGLFQEWNENGVLISIKNYCNGVLWNNNGVLIPTKHNYQSSFNTRVY